MANNPYDLLFKYISGNCTDSEKSQIETWIALSTENKNEFEKIQKLWKASLEHGAFNPDIDAAWEKVARSTGKPTLRVSFKASPSRLGWISGIAASLLLVALSYFYFVGFNNQWTVLTANLEKSVHALPDGSRVWLKKDSRISYFFDEDDRALKLNGEAFFEVQRIVDKPFVIDLLGDAEVKVLGTSFYVKAKKGDDLQVSVKSGKVSFTDSDNDEKSIILEANQEGVLVRTSGDMIRREVDDPNDLSWQRGILVFNKTPLSKVVTELIEFYNTDISIDNDALGNCLITSRFDNQSLEEVLNVIKKLISAELIQTESGFVLTGEGC